MDGGCDGNPSAALAEDGAPSVRTAGEDLCRAPRVDERGASAPVFAVTPAEAATLLALRPRRRSTMVRLRQAPAGGPVPEVAVEAWRIDDEEDAWRPLLPRMTVLLDERCAARATRGAPGTSSPPPAASSAEPRPGPARARSRRRLRRGCPRSAPRTPAPRRCCARGGARRVWLSEEQARLRAELPAWASDVLALPAAELMVCEHCLLTAEGPATGAAPPARAAAPSATSSRPPAPAFPSRWTRGDARASSTRPIRRLRLIGLPRDCRLPGARKSATLIGLHVMPSTARAARGRGC